MKNESQFLSKNDKPIQNLKPRTNLKLDNLFVNGNNTVCFFFFTVIFNQKNPENVVFLIILKGDFSVLDFFIVKCLTQDTNDQ